MNAKPRSSRTTAEILRVNPRSPEEDRIRRAAAIIRAGGLVCFPTRCLYGLGADALNAKAVDRVFTAKGRPADKPLPVFISQVSQLDLLVKHVTPMASAIMNRFWPGRLTIVLEARSDLPPNLTAGTGCIGVRLPGHPIAVALVQAAGFPITATSANLSNQPGSSRVDQLAQPFLSRVDLVLDAGPLKGGVGSTVVDLSQEVPVVLREGEISKVEVLAAIKSVR